MQILSCTSPGKREDEKTISKTGKNRQKPATAAVVGKQKECLANKALTLPRHCEGRLSRPVAIPECAEVSPLRDDQGAGGWAMSSAGNRSARAQPALGMVHRVCKSLEGVQIQALGRVESEPTEVDFCRASASGFHRDPPGRRE